MHHSIACLITIAPLASAFATWSPRPLLHLPTNQNARALDPGRRLPVRMEASDGLRAFMDELLESDSDVAREASMSAAVQRWWADGDADKKSDALVKLMTERGVSVQTAALAAHERGEDTSEASEILQTIVNMTFHVKILVRDLKQAAQDDGV